MVLQKTTLETESLNQELPFTRLTKKDPKGMDL